MRENQLNDFLSNVDKDHMENLIYTLTWISLSLFCLYVAVQCLSFRKSQRYSDALHELGQKILTLEKSEVVLSDFARGFILEFGFKECSVVEVLEDQSDINYLFHFTVDQDLTFEKKVLPEGDKEKKDRYYACWRARKTLLVDKRHLFLPIVINGRVHKILRFVSHEAKRFDAKFLEDCSYLGWMIGVIKNQLNMHEILVESSYVLEQQHYALNSSAIVAFTDAKGRITNVNEKFTEIAGFTREELIGRDHRVINSGHHPQEFFSNLWKTISSGQIWRGEVKNKRKDGSYYWVDSTIVPLRDKNGQIKQYVAIRYDITHRKEVEFSLTQALQESAFYKTAIDQSAIVAMTDKNGVINYVNDFFCKISGYSREELIGRDHRILNSGKMPEGFFNQMWKEIKSGKVWRGEVCNKAKDGKFYWVDTVIIPFLDVNGEPEKYIAIRSDITLRKESENELLVAKEEAVKAARVKAEFLANMSHEIRTPMNGIIGITDLLIEDEKNEKLLGKLNLIRNCGDSLLSIVDDVLDFSKIEAGKVELENKPFDLHAAVKDVCSLFEAKAEEKDVQIDFSSHSSGEDWVTGDLTKFKQVLSNLVSNSIKFTQSGFVKVSYYPHHSNLGPCDYHFCIEDTGVGISEEVMPKLFTSFTQADPSTTRNFGGTGLGLSICKGICEMMGGRIWGESELGKGSKFSFILPFVKIESTSLPSAQIREKRSIQKVLSKSFPLRILIAEDNYVNQVVISGLLEKMGYQAEIARDGAEVIEKVKEKTFDLIFMDCHMPRVDGFSATKVIKEQLHSSPYIVALTASSFEEDKKRCLEAGMDDFLSKPVSPQAVGNILKKVPQNSSMRLQKKNFKVELNLKDMMSVHRDLVMVDHILSYFAESVEQVFEQLSSCAKMRDNKSCKIEAHTLKGMMSALHCFEGMKLCEKMEKIDDISEMESREILEKISILILELNEQISARLNKLKAS